MESLGGKISDKLRGLFTKDDPAWTPTRPATPKKAAKLPKHVQSESLGRGGKKKR